MGTKTRSGSRDGASDCKGHSFGGEYLELTPHERIMPAIPTFAVRYQVPSPNSCLVCVWHIMRDSVFIVPRLKGRETIFNRRRHTCGFQYDL